MAEPMFADHDDLPRTLRRERDAREREARERELREREREIAEARDRELQRQSMAEAQEPAYGGAPRTYQQAGWDMPPPAASGVVTRLELPFFHLMAFFLKAVLAAIPALILLAGLLWLGGKGLALAFPWLARMQIFIQFPQ